MLEEGGKGGCRGRGDEGTGPQGTLLEAADEHLGTDPCELLQPERFRGTAQQRAGRGGGGGGGGRQAALPPPLLGAWVLKGPGGGGAAHQGALLRRQDDGRAMTGCSTIPLLLPLLVLTVLLLLQLLLPGRSVQTGPGKALQNHLRVPWEGSLCDPLDGCCYVCCRPAEASSSISGSSSGSGSGRRRSRGGGCKRNCHLYLLQSRSESVERGVGRRKAAEAQMEGDLTIQKAACSRANEGEGRALVGDGFRDKPLQHPDKRLLLGPAVAEQVSSPASSGGGGEGAQGRSSA